MAEGERKPGPRLIVRVRRFFRGMGEVLAFFAAGAAAIAELALGRWPRTRPPPPAEPPADKPSERVAPFPIHD